MNSICDILGSVKGQYCEQFKVTKVTVKIKEYNMSWLEIDKSLLEDVQAESVSTGGTLESGLYTVAVKQCYLRKTDSGAVMLELETETQDELKVFWSTCVKSGDAKGNKATYTNKSGQEQILPGVSQAIHLFQACGLDLTTEEPIESKVERRDTVIDAKVFKAITGKKFMACVRQYENEYNGDINIKYDIENFLDVDGKNSKGELLSDKFLEKIEKSPIKLLKKAKATQASSADAAVVASSGW